MFKIPQCNFQHTVSFSICRVRVYLFTDKFLLHYSFKCWLWFMFFLLFFLCVFFFTDSVIGILDLLCQTSIAIIFFWVSYFFLFCFIVMEIFISLFHISFVYFDESIPSCASCTLVLILEMVVISFTFFSVFSQFLFHTFLLCAHFSSAFMDYWFVMLFHIFYGLSNNIWFRLDCCATAFSAFRLGLECFHQLKNFDSQLISFWN